MTAVCGLDGPNKTMVNEVAPQTCGAVWDGRKWVDTPHPNAGETVQEAPAGETTALWQSPANPWTMDGEMDFDDGLKVDWTV